MPAEKAICSTCSKPFMIIDQEQKFYKKKSLPYPTACPECRQQERFMFREKREMHERTCDKCGKDMTSTYMPGSKYTVYCRECFDAYMS